MHFTSTSPQVSTPPVCCRNGSNKNVLDLGCTLAKLALISAIRHTKADIAGHPDDEKYPLLAEDLVKACAETGTAIEMNNASLTPGGYRGDAAARDCELLRLCRRRGVPVTLGSDSHGAAHIGDFTYALKLVEEENFPEELILNTSVEKFIAHLRAHGRRI